MSSTCNISPLVTTITPTESTYYYNTNVCNLIYNNPPNLLVSVDRNTSQSYDYAIQNGMLNTEGVPIAVPDDRHILQFRIYRRQGIINVDMSTTTLYYNADYNVTSNYVNILFLQSYVDNANHRVAISYQLSISTSNFRPSTLISVYSQAVRSFALFNTINNPNPGVNITVEITDDDKNISTIGVRTNDTNTYQLVGNRLIITPSATSVVSTFTLDNPGYKIFGSKLWVQGCDLDSQLRTLENYECASLFDRENLFGYGVIRYVMAGLIYGYFDLNFLDQNFTTQFLADLATSHFSDYLELFTDPLYGITGYELYFS